MSGVRWLVATVCVVAVAGCTQRPLDPKSAQRTVASTEPGDPILWTRTYGGPGRDVGGSIADAADGGWLVVGSTRSFGNGQDAIWLLSITSEGDTLWTRTNGAPPATRTATMSVAPRSRPSQTFSCAFAWVVADRQAAA